MTTILRRPDIARDLLDRAKSAEKNWAIPASSIAEATEAEVTSMREVDRVNAQVLRRIVSLHGWPGRSLVGTEAAQAALAIALHADHDPPFQRTLLRMLYAAVQLGEATPAQWAHLYDRWLIHDQRVQVYGTQYRYRSAGLEPHPITDPEHLDRRRASVGLPPYEEQAYAARQHHTRQPEPHRPVPHQ
ncbi:DUF6624 domain-containing protein [Streptomyces scopuliridis]